MKELDLEEMFAAGARSAARDHGMEEKDAEALAERLCKEARPRVKIVDDDEDEGDTWWSRNKGWALPTGIGIGAFLLGADAGRGRKDRSSWTNALGNFWDRLQALFGISNSSLVKSLTQANPDAILNRGESGQNASDSAGTPAGPGGAYPKGTY